MLQAADLTIRLHPDDDVGQLPVHPQRPLRAGPLPQGRLLPPAGNDLRVRRHHQARVRLGRRRLVRERVLPAGAPSLAAAYSPAGSLLASGQADGTVVLWDTTTGRRLRILNGHSGAVAATTMV